MQAAAWLPWAVFSLGMFLVWSVVFWRTSSFKKSTVAALVTGKTFAVVYKLAGLDRVVYTLYNWLRPGGPRNGCRGAAQLPREPRGH